MHDDEIRSSVQMRRMVAEEVALHPLGAVDRIVWSQQQIDSLSEDLRRSRAELKSATVEKGSIARSLDTARVEIQRLQGEVAADPHCGVSAEAPLVGARPSAPSTSRLPSHDMNAATAQPAQVTVEDLVELLDRAPSPEALEAALSRLWFESGSLSSGLDLLERHADLASAMTDRGCRLAARFRGTAALSDRLPRLVPPASQGAAYLVERGRVMYCAHSTPIFESNGYSVRTGGLVAGLRTVGADVFVVARSGYPWDVESIAEKPRQRKRKEHQLDGIRYVHRPEGNLSASRPDVYIGIAADAFVREARLQRPELIHAASNYLTALPALIAARRLGIPFVYEVRGLWEITEASGKPGWEATERYAWQAEMEAFVASHADAVLAITEETRAELVRRGVDGSKIELLPNGVDPDALLPIPRDAAYAAAHKISTTDPVIGFAGSVVEYEGLDDLLAASAILRTRGVAFQVAVAGSGSALPGLRKGVLSAGLSGQVRLLGNRPQEEIARFLSCMDIIACPRKSLPVTEMVSPLKPLEAFAASKPVVLSDVSPHRELVGSSTQRGLLYTAGDPEALADALQRLIEDAELRTAKGRAGRLWVVDERQWRVLGETVRAAHQRAARAATDTASPSRPLSDLVIGLIADEFTTRTLERASRVVALDPGVFDQQLGEESPDLVLIESAWNGNGGLWHRGIGNYSEEEDRPLADLLARCRELGIPTLFWNKEDPVHIERFLHTGRRVDHVFTTDADMIGRYLGEGPGACPSEVTTASSMPFYADPAVHNPLPSHRPYESSAAFAGTYYGERYAQRSQQLERMLRAAQEAVADGLVIYDRQLAEPDSPYRFPPEFTGSVRGALPYDEVLASYKSHAVSLNVNSVAGSPTMFSRRVVEIAASGGVVLSDSSRGIAETLGELIPQTNSELLWKMYLRAWTADAEAHRAEAWNQMRSVLRSHTVQTALVLMARTAGIPVHGFTPPTWGCDLTEANASSVLAQSIRPAIVRVADPESRLAQEAQRAGLSTAGADVEIARLVDWWAVPPAAARRTWAEDMLSATRWGAWSLLLSRPGGIGRGDDRVLARPGVLPDDLEGLMTRIDRGLPATLEQGRALSLGAALDALCLTMADTAADAVQEDAEHALRREGRSERVLIAGHDLKFAATWIEHLRSQGRDVVLDEWSSHVDHDEARSLQLLAQADVVFCEWGLGNAVWYSHRVRPEQKLVVRVHAQELRRHYLRGIKHAAVDRFVFVGALMREAAVQSHGVPREKTCVIPNMVDSSSLDLPKTPEAEFTVGLVGLVPQAKRLDRAVELMDLLIAQDPRWTLRVRGRTPADFPWMADRPEEMAWYEDCYRRIDQLNQKAGREVVVFDAHGDDMDQWFRGVGYAISVSDLESFHLTLPDGAASGACPVSLAWPGADRIYPRDWLVASVAEMAQRILRLRTDDRVREDLAREAGTFVDGRMKGSVVHSALDRVLDEHPAPPVRAGDLFSALDEDRRREHELAEDQAELESRMKAARREAQELKAALRRREQALAIMTAQRDAMRASIGGRIQRRYWKARQRLRR